MLWKKPSGMKYTDMCIFIDANMEKIIKPGEYPEIEEKVYNYLWLLIKALAIKKCMFTDFKDYDSYAFFAATRLFFALRKNQLNQGKTIKGKLIRPIKSCLNYTKALLYPMKIEFQRETYNEIISEEFVSKQFDSFALKEQLKSQAITQNSARDKYLMQLKSSIEDVESIINKVVSHSPFLPESIDCKYLQMSIILNCLNALRVKQKLDSDSLPTIVWGLPKSMSNYVAIMVKEFYTELKQEIMECYASTSIPDGILEKIISSGEPGKSYEE